MEKQRLAVIGHPIAHSASPKMHNAALKELDLPYTYTALGIPSIEALESFFQEMRNGAYRGINVTIPYKEAVIPHLDALDPEAEKIGAVNTIVNDQGKLIGYNTDGQGCLEDLREFGIEPKGKRIILLGAGGAAKAIATALISTKPNSLHIMNRSQDNAKTLADALEANCPVSFGPIEPQRCMDAELLINCTPIGMSPNNEQSPLPSQGWAHEALHCYDTIYNPRQTRLLTEGKAQGASIQNGAGMLARQGALAFQHFTGQGAPYNTMRKALQQ